MTEHDDWDNMDDSLDNLGEGLPPFGSKGDPHISDILPPELAKSLPDILEMILGNSHRKELCWVEQPKKGGQDIFVVPLPFFYEIEEILDLKESIKGIKESVESFPYLKRLAEGDTTALQPLTLTGVKQLKSVLSQITAKILVADLFALAEKNKDKKPPILLELEKVLDYDLDQFKKWVAERFSEGFDFGEDLLLEKIFVALKTELMDPPIKEFATEKKKFETKLARLLRNIPQNLKDAKEAPCIRYPVSEAPEAAKIYTLCREAKLGASEIAEAVKIYKQYKAGKLTASGG